MKRFWLICSLCCIFSFGCATNIPIWKLAEQTAATVEVDSDSNNAIDVTYGGTNATTAAGARTNLGVTATEDMDTEAEFESEFFAILTPGEAEGDIGSVLDDGSGDVPQLYQAPAAFTDTDTTPDVSSQTIYITANTSGTTISDFDAGAGSLKNGQILFIIINDANTTFDFTSSGLEGIGSDYSPGSGEMMLFTYSTTDNQWHCLEVGGGGSGSVENDSYGSGWDGDTTNSPSQNAIYDYNHQYDTDDDGSLIDESWFDLDNLGDITNTGSAGKILYDDGDGTYSFQSPTYETADAAITKSDEAETLSAAWNLGTPASGVLTNCTFPTLNQNTTGTAANLSGTPALPDGTTATTQSASDNSTKLATTAYVDAAGGGFVEDGAYQFGTITTTNPAECSDGAIVSGLKTFGFAFDPGAYYDFGTVTLLPWDIGDESPNGIIIDEWSCSCNVDPDVEIDANLIYFDAFIGLANTVVIDAIDTSNGASTEDTDANINSGSAIPNGKKIGIDWDADPEGTCTQFIFTGKYHAVD